MDEDCVNTKFAMGHYFCKRSVAGMWGTLKVAPAPPANWVSLG